jgi:ABC-type enterochelin transport system permease subunit
VLGAWQVMPDDLKAALPPNVVYGVSMVLLVAGIVGRVVAQPKAE